MFLKKNLMAAGFACLMAVPNVAGAEGFGINEWSAEGVAMGGARMFAEDDAASIAYNPASIVKVKNKAYSMGATYLSPHGKHTAWDKNGTEKGSGHNKVSPAIAPYMYYVEKLNDKEWWGIGSFVRFGNQCVFEKDAVVSSNNESSELMGLSITPTYARKFNDKLSMAIGAEINYVNLKLKKSNNLVLGDVKANGNSTALGWNAAVNYAFDDKNEMGFVYRSKVTHTMDANFSSTGSPLAPGTGIGKVNTTAHGTVVLPDSYTIGYGHKFNDKTRMELQAMYTRWSTYDNLNLALDTPVLTPNGAMGVLPDEKNWKNGWRYALGIEHQLSDKYTLMGGLAYDQSGVPDATADYMVPTGSRTTASIGVQYHDKIQKVAFAYGHIFVGDKDIKGKSSDPFATSKMYDNYVTIFSVGYQRTF